MSDAVNTDKFQELYRLLNPGQKKAVDSIEGPVMVMAGPGTGKTQTLTMRIANILLQTQMDPWNILCLTFTESGVVAMRERLVSIIGTPAYYVRIHTFHSFCNDVIKEHSELFALTASWQMLTDVENVELLRSLIDSLPGTSPLKPFGDSYLYMRDISGNIKQLKQEDISPERFREVLGEIKTFTTAAKEEVVNFSTLKPKDRSDAVCDALHEKLLVEATTAKLPESLVLAINRMHEKYVNNSGEAEDKKAAGKVRTAYKNDVKKWFEKMSNQLPKQEDMCLIYERYQKFLSTEGRYDYEDMIMMVVAEFKKNKELLTTYQEEFQYILVDEYQDTNGAQNEIVELLGSYDSSPNVFVVGDDKQSIYRFQGASLNNMLDFYLKYKESITIVPLKENYRSQPNVLQAAGAVIDHNKESITKYIPGITNELLPAAGRKEELLEYHEYDSEHAEEFAVASRVKELIKSGTEPREIAVLFRYNRDGQALFDVMQRLGIPAKLEAGENVFDNICVSQALILLSYIENTHREELLADILQFDWLKLPALDVLKVINYAGQNRKKLFKVLTDANQLQEIGIQDPAPFQNLLEKIADWRQKSSNLVLQDFLHEVFTVSGWLEYVLEQEDKLSCLQKLTRLLQEAKQLNQMQHSLTLTDFINRINLLRVHNIPLQTAGWQTAENAVHLMTAHKSKGLEFEHVIITRMNNKHWGNNPDNSKLSLPHGFIRHDFIVARENNEDERRLFYVALTRAKQSLWLTRSKHSGSGRPTVPSLFLYEIPTEGVKTEEHIENEADVITRTVEGMVKPIPKINRDGVKGWLRLLLKNHVLSVTHLNNYLDCPRKFYLVNVLQIPSARSPHQALGSAVHKALEEFLGEFEITHVVPVEELLVDRFKKALERQVLTPEQASDAAEVGEKILRQYYQEYKDAFSSDTKREYDFSSHNITLDGIRLTGLIDKIELVDKSEKQTDGAWKENAKVNVVDYKTGKPENGLKKLKEDGDYYRQLVFYKLLCDLSPRFPFTMVSAEIDFIQKSETKGFVKKKVVIQDSEVEDLKKLIKEVWQKMQNLEFLEDGAGCKKDDCEYCN